MHWQRVKLKLKAFVTLVSFLVQLHYHETTLVVTLVIFLQVQFSRLSDGDGHTLLVPLAVVPLVFGLVPLLLVALPLVPLVFGFVPLLLGLVPLLVVF